MSGDRVETLESMLYWDRLGAGDLVRSDDWVQITTPAAKTHFRNGVLRSRLDPPDVDARIDATIRHYAAHGVPFRWLVTPATRPPDMADALLRKGFEHFQVLEGMVARPADFAPPARADVEVKSIGEAERETWLDIMERGWNMPAAGVERFSAEITRELAREPQRTFYFLASIEGVPAGECSLTLHDGFAHFDGSVVLEDYRRRGIYREMILERMRFLRGRDVDLVTNHCVSTTSAPVCRKLGFETICEFQVYVLPDEA